MRDRSPVAVGVLVDWRWSAGRMYAVVWYEEAARKLKFDRAVQV